jgi:hypothetical protein
MVLDGWNIYEQALCGILVGASAMLFLPLVSALLATAIADVFAGPAAKLPVPAGFVTTKGTQFELDGKPFVRRNLIQILHSIHARIY